MNLETSSTILMVYVKTTGQRFNKITKYELIS